MEQGIILKSVYNRIMNHEFDYSDFSSRLSLQKIVYLLQEMGLNIGGYGFAWYKHGPYSQSLQEDAYNSRCLKTADLNFTQIAADKFDQLNAIVNEPTIEYNHSCWLEAMASIRYMKKIEQYDDQEVLKELVNRKQHLANLEANKKALDIVNTIFN